MTAQKTIAAALFALLATGCFDSDESRRRIVDMNCDTEQCAVLWDGTDQWSAAIQASALDEMPDVEPSSVWACEQDPVVDACVEVDGNGHVGCFWIYGDVAVAVAPSCAVADLGWVDVGLGMAASPL